MVAHKLRLALTTASITLGVAFVTGTLILTDTMGLAFDQLFGKVSSGTDAVVRTEAPFTQSEGVSTSHGPIAASVLDAVSRAEGVRAAEGMVSGYALLTDPDGKAILSKGGAPNMGYNMPEDEQLRGDVELLSGEAPDEAGEVAVDATSAAEGGLELGSTIKVLFTGSTEEFTVVGTVGFGGEEDLGGTTSAYFNATTAQRLIGQPGFFDSIGVSAEEGVSPAELAERLDAIVPEGAEAVTGKAVAQENSDAIAEELKFVSAIFLAFAFISLFVGAFIIWNTFTMIVTQRSREIALLRAIGATRRQVMRSLVLEAFVLGLAASAIGIGVGVLTAIGLRVLMDAVGFSLPSTSLQIQTSTIVVGMIVGTVVTVVAALVPARRATKVLPVEALRESTQGAEKPARLRAAIGAVMLAGGAAGMLTALYGDVPFFVFGIGLLAAMLGVIVGLPIAVRPLARVIGIPLRWRGLPGELATQNAMRNPRRTSSTAAALMIGLTLVVSMGVFASSLKASFSDMVGDDMNADLFVTPANLQGPGFSPAAIGIVRDVPGVETVAAESYGDTRINGSDTFYSAIDPANTPDVTDLGVVAGSVADMGMDGVIVKESKAESEGWEVGDRIEAEFAHSGKHELRIAALYEGLGWYLDDYLLSMEGHVAYAGPQLMGTGLVLLEAGAELGEVQDAITAALADNPDAKVLDKDGFEAEASGFIDQLLTFVTVMLLLAVLIALLGIVNTLALSVFERTRELGLLRAVGMTVRQVRTMVRWESVVIALIGAVSGAVLGIAIGMAMSQVFQDFGINSISVPGPQIAIYVALAAVAGVLAAIGPARSASRVDVLKAVVSE